MINSFVNKNEFLSNFYPSQINYEGITFPTVEHAFQAMKTLNLEQRIAIANASTPGVAKRMGRQVTLRADWENVKDEIMYQCLKLKFADKDLEEALLETFDEYLEEGNSWHDNYWGNCHCEKCKNIHGKNRLGTLLMKVRDEIRTAKEHTKVLVVVDMQNDFITDALGSPDAVKIVPNVLAKVKEYHDNNYPIVFTRDTHYSNYSETQEGKYLPVPHCIKGTKGWEIIPELSAFAKNCVDKITFGSVTLPEEIEKAIGDASTFELEFVGVCTDICVVSNVLYAKAYFVDVPITVDASCCAGTTPENHNCALTTMKCCQVNVINN